MKVLKEKIKQLKFSTFIFFITCASILSSCIVREDRPRHHRHPRREVIVVEHR